MLGTISPAALLHIRAVGVHAAELMNCFQTRQLQQTVLAPLACSQTTSYRSSRESKEEQVTWLKT